MLPTGRLSGILLPLFSLRSRTDLGIGDFGALDGLFGWMVAARQKMLMLLPLLPTAPGDSSPYSTRSAFGLNPLFIDVQAVPEFQEAGGMGSFTPGERQMLEEARASRGIRYDLVFKLKEAALHRAFSRFEELHWRTGDARGDELRAWQHGQSAWLDSYALYAAISKDQQRRPWWEWPAPLRDRDHEALDAERARLAHDVLLEEWLQWVAERQWEQVRTRARVNGILLCGDEPFILSQDSADCWAHPKLLRRDARLGAPPDDFSADGQDWGLPYFDFDAMEKEGYSWLKFRARKSSAYYDLRRVDHAVGYFRQWIRDEKTPKGRFVPADEAAQKELGKKHFELLSESAGIIAEDLGVIPKWVRETLKSLGLPGYRVTRWERDEGVYRNPHEFPAVSLATTGTHDTETLREWWEAIPDWEREAAAKGVPELAAVAPVTKTFTPQVHEALLTATMASGSNLSVIPWQDVLGSRDRVNLPGSMTDQNWAYRIDCPNEELLRREDTLRAADLMARLTVATNR
ncbi:MAG: 4-alpha-glucanotransferase [Myxococcaceae bacterium]